MRNLIPLFSRSYAAQHEGRRVEGRRRSHSLVKPIFGAIWVLQSGRWAGIGPTEKSWREASLRARSYAFDVCLVTMPERVWTILSRRPQVAEVVFYRQKTGLSQQHSKRTIALWSILSFTVRGQRASHPADVCPALRGS